MAKKSKNEKSCLKTIGYLAVAIVIIIIIVLVATEGLANKANKQPIKSSPTTSTGAQVKDNSKVVPATNVPQENNANANTSVTNATNYGTIDLIKISDQTEKVVKDGKTTFAADTPELKASIYISGAKKGGQVSMKLLSTDTEESSDAVMNTIDSDGDVISNFSFKNPAIPGNYKLIAIITGGTQVEQAFQIK